MEKIVSYFNRQLTSYMIEKKQLESEFESKKISFLEVERTISRLIDKENDTDTIFRANIGGEEFRNKEVHLLNEQLTSIQSLMDSIEKKIQECDLKIAEVNDLLQHTRNISSEYDEIKNQSIVEKEIAEDSTPMNQNEVDKVTLIENLRNISSRIDTALKIEKMDRERAKMELNLARVKLLFCIDDLEKK